MRDNEPALQQKLDEALEAVQSVYSLFIQRDILTAVEKRALQRAAKVLENNNITLPKPLVGRERPR